MRYGSYITDASYDQSGRLQGPYSGLPSSAGTLDKDVYLPEALVHPLAGGLLRSSLGSKGVALTGPLKAGRSRAGRDHNTTLRIG